ncbi:MAG: Xaa-Pro peptidase family protein [Desulfuromonadales bacterium]|nr:Xaa-Pro peptidase family protein [Desulfuromonadales bacterium]
MRLTPKSELQTRIARLQEEMSRHDIDAVVMAQNADLFYFTGSIQQGILYVPAAGEPLYLVRKDHGRARMESGLREVVPLRSPKDIPALLGDYGLPLPTTLGMELDVLPVTTHQRLLKPFGACRCVDASPLIRTVRAVKSDYEIGIMKDAALIVGRVHRRAREVIREGITDLELAAELEFEARKAGHQGMIRMRGFNNELFYAHIFSGPDSAVPTYSDTPLGGVGLNPAFPQGASYKKIRRNEPITVDFGGAFDGYIVDQTRMFCIGGLPEQLIKAYDDMLAIQAHAMRIAVPGAIWGAVYDSCLAMATELGYADHFMGAKGAQVSFIGHGVGVELDEYPFIARGFHDDRLEENMTFAFEPKVVYPGLGSVGIENTFWVAADGLKAITVADQELVVL